MDIEYHQLREALSRAGLPADPIIVLRSPYMFRNRSGNQVLVGNIVAIELSDEGGLELHATNPRFRGRPILSFIYNPDQGWATRHPDRPEDVKKLDALPEDASDDEVDATLEEMIASRFEWGVLNLL